MTNAERRELFNRLAAGQWDGVTYPSAETRHSAILAFDELMARDPSFRALVAKNDRARRERRERAWHRRLWKRLSR